MTMASTYEGTDILKCGMCSSLLNNPKRLPCLHMFCESCLTSAVTLVAREIEKTGYRNFQCPICKSEYPCPQKPSCVSNYVNEFPTYNIIDAVIKRETQYNVICGPCQREDKEEKAELWCVECDEGFCQECFGAHRKIRFPRKHKTLAANEAWKYLPPITVDRYCLNHAEQKWEHFCRDHATPCCKKCAQTVHGKCGEKVESLNAAAKNVKPYCQKHLIKRVNEDIDALSENMRNMKTRLKEVRADRDGIKSVVKSFCTDVRTCIDKMESKFDSELNEIPEQHLKELETMAFDFKQMYEIISNCKKLLEKFMETASDVDLFLEKEIIEKKIEEQEKKMADIPYPCRVKYEVTLSPELVSAMSSMQSIGTIKCTKISPIQAEVGKFQEIPSTSDISMRECKPHKIATFSTNKCNTDYVHGIELLPDGKILFTSNQDKSLCLFDAAGTVKEEVNLQGHMYDVTVLNEKEAAVTYGGDLVLIIDMNTMSMKRRITIQGLTCSLWGITSYGDRLFVVCFDGIVVMNINGSLIKKTETPAPDSNVRYIIAVSDTNLCYTNENEGSVICIDINGTVVFTYQHRELMKPRGITSDSEGVIYVAGYGLTMYIRLPRTDIW